MTVVIDGQERQYYDAIGESSIAFSPDSKRVVYVALLYNRKLLRLRVKETARVVIDDTHERAYDAIVSLPIFSPDSRCVAYAVQQGGQQFVVVDGRPGHRYSQVIGPETYRRIIFDTPHSLHYLALKKDGVVCLVEEKLAR